MALTRLDFLHFHPERIAWIGMALLGVGCMMALPFFWMMQMADPFLFTRKERSKKIVELSPYSFSLGIGPSSICLPFPNLQGQIAFSFDPPRPTETLGEGTSRGIVRLETGQCKRVVLPCRLDLHFQKEELQFAQESSPFWVSLSASSNDQIEAKTWVLGSDEAPLNVGSFQIKGQDCPIQPAQDFAEGSAFRLLAEAKWWGRDLFKPIGERLEIGDLLELKEGEWLFFKEDKWQKGAPEKDLPIARIQSQNAKTLILEGWDLDGHTRMALPLTLGPPLKVRSEEFLSMVRVRSEKQISCTLEKQCIVLKLGDWVLKNGSRWKILRKKEERDAFLGGKLFGELFILDQIVQKQGQKIVQGRLFNPGRTQAHPIEVAAQASRKSRGGK